VCEYEVRSRQHVLDEQEFRKQATASVNMNTLGASDTVCEEEILGTTRQAMYV